MRTKESGFTFLELVLSATIGVIVLTIVLGVLRVRAVQQEVETPRIPRFVWESTDKVGERSYATVIRDTVSGKCHARVLTLREGMIPLGEVPCSPPPLETPTR